MHAVTLARALIHPADLEAWAAGLPPVVRHYDHCAGLGGAAVAVGAGGTVDGPPSCATAGASCGSSSCGSSCCGGGPFTSGRALAPAAGPTSGSGAAGPYSGCSPGSSANNCGTSISTSTSSSSSNSGLVRLKLFSLNDYLGLASHPDVAAAAARSALRVGLGPRSSALVAGYSHSHRQLEAGLAQLKRKNPPNRRDPSTGAPRSGRRRPRARQRCSSRARALGVPVPGLALGRRELRCRARSAAPGIAVIPPPRR
ncbi:hypothetical protein CHLRE_08g373347v5 [Chlamydomonas reinhardtii]|uniref:Aminotransferase class I/classII domain-containing protein n=1 Tax=Chlamydomonas reinhardtii TaxID=3055 RepID=A0A2K3DHD2_CHLRE|nr:uncharacterized protein CHLRE_08g373347v5 [Chlamydomonas reinhardtii]PNW79952.1 hypothetical protein CHLRE_08g373347v5 [Chlamydomonas reinhardtii]